MGVLYDYFRAPDASTAAAMLEWVGGPMACPQEPPLDVVDGKGIDPEVMMRTLQSLLTGIPYDELPWGEMVALTPGRDDGPAVEGLTAELRDALADAEVGRLPEVAEQWVRTEEFYRTTAADVLPFLHEVTALARRARQDGELLYCWCSL